MLRRLMMLMGPRRSRYNEWGNRNRIRRRRRGRRSKRKVNRRVSRKGRRRRRIRG